jgi:hypothetical protein
VAVGAAAVVSVVVAADMVVAAVVGAVAVADAVAAIVVIGVAAATAEIVATAGKSVNSFSWRRES